ncbi:MAG: GNAT family N-acetyltransferase [Chitinophagales bacterium]
MNALNLKKINFASLDYKKTVALRDLLLRKPLGLKFSEAELEKETNMLHLAFFDRENCIACLVLVPESKGKIKMRQVAVNEAYQSKGIGKKLIAAAEKYAREKGFKKMYCHARATALPFYQKLKYQQVGEAFEEVGIPHYKLEKNLVV